VSGVSVSFAVGAGGGSVGSPATVTDGKGNAFVQWTLGDAGAQTLIATVNNVAQALFTAYAFDPSMCTGLPLEADDVVYGRLNPSQCLASDGTLTESYPVLLPAGKYTVSAVSADFNAELELRDEKLRLVANNYDAPVPYSNAAIGIITGQSFYYIVVKSHTPAGGNYSVVMRQAFNGFDACTATFVTRGISVNQEISKADCRRSDTELEKRFRIYLKADENISVAVDDLSYSGVLAEITDLQHKPLLSGRYNENLAFVAPEDGFYVIVAYGLDYEINQFRLSIQ
jgi:hypothetical protein